MAVAEPVLLVGTTKGVFIGRADAGRKTWRLDGPFLRGHAIYATALDTRAGRRRIWAATQNMHWGTVLAWSDDLGANWTVPEESNVKFPEGSGLSLKQIWQIMPASSAEPDVLYCGVEPAALFVSHDAGATWAPVQGLLDHPHRKQWQPGGGGLCLHTIVLDPGDPERLLVAISTGGVYRSDDGGATWRARSQGVRAEFLPPDMRYPEFGQCVHKVVNHPHRPERLFLQNHWGLYRSDDWGDSWTDIANKGSARGVPSDFGFGMAMHPQDEDTVYIVPLESDVFRIVPEAKLRVYRTDDAGASWAPLSAGLPQRDAYETVLRDALATDTLDPAGVYFGTRTGKLYGSADAGESWQCLAHALPPIVSVKTGTLGSRE